MTIGIIDDEVTNRLLIKNILQAYAPSESILVEEGLIGPSVEKLNKSQPQLIFLDIELRNGTGFDIIKQLSYKPQIIFTTAYSQYAIDAIKVHAFDYILKPINEEELVDSLNACRKKLNEEVAPANGFGMSNNFFTIATHEGKLALNLDEIWYFEGSGSYTFCITNNKKIIFSKNIGEVEKELPADTFFRTHHSYLVNLSKISKIEIKRNGKIQLSNREIIPLSQRKIKEFQKLFQSAGNKKA